MNNEAFENQMFNHVNENCKMKELDRQEVERAAWEEYQYICKCKKINAVIGIIVLTLCFVTIVFAMCVLNWTGFLPAMIGMAVNAVIGLVFGMTIRSLCNGIRK